MNNDGENLNVDGPSASTSAAAILGVSSSSSSLAPNAIVNENQIVHHAAIEPAVIVPYAPPPVGEPQQQRPSTPSPAPLNIDDVIDLVIDSPERMANAVVAIRRIDDIENLVAGNRSI